jgi:hypothetical protein
MSPVVVIATMPVALPLVHVAIPLVRLPRRVLQVVLGKLDLVAVKPNKWGHREEEPIPM